MRRRHFDVLVPRACRDGYHVLHVPRPSKIWISQSHTEMLLIVSMCYLSYRGCNGGARLDKSDGPAWALASTTCDSHVFQQKCTGHAVDRSGATLAACQMR